MIDKRELMVTIRCLAYNHEPYIRQCLDGIIMQKTNFRFEAIVHDDASTDGTVTIIKEYAEKFPDIIKPIIETENQYSKRDGSLTRIMNSHMHGKYIAICEGDDYWIDPLKLQKQVDFLERNPDYSMCFHKADTLVFSNKISNLYKDLYNHLEEREYTGEEILEKWTIPTASVLYRNGIFIPIDKRFIHGDIILFLSCEKNGHIYCLADKMSVYRKNEGGVTHQKIHFSRFINHYNAIIDHFGDRYSNIIFKRKINCYVNHFISNRLNSVSVEILFDVIKQRRFIVPFILYLPIRFMSIIYNKLKVKL